jgi:hypothetical protein
MTLVNNTRWNGQWKIVNVLWALTPKEDQPR